MHFWASYGGGVCPASAPAIDAQESFREEGGEEARPCFVFFVCVFVYPGGGLQQNHGTEKVSEGLLSVTP